MERQFSLPDNHCAKERVLLFDFNRKLCKRNKENQTADQTELKTVQQAEIPSDSVPENAAKTASSPEVAAEVTPAAFDPEKVIAGTVYAMMDAMKIELEEIKVLAEAFFASEKYLQSNALPLFRSRQWKKCIQRCRYAAEAYIAEQDGMVQECWQEALAQADATDSPEWTCLLLRNALQHRQPGTELLKSAALTQLFAQMRDLERAWRQCFLVPAEATKEKGIRILHGEYGEYNYCIGYDYAHHVFVAFDPDDNYYHWGDYDINPIDRETAAYFLKSSLSEYPEPSDPEAAESYYNSASNADIKARVIR